MANQDTTFHGKVPMGQKIAFGLGMLTNQMFPAALGVFMVVLIEGLGFPTWTLMLIYILPKLFDAITDPIMGFISDNTKSKWGRRRQYVFLGGILLAVSYGFMWQLNANNSWVFNFTYFMLWSFVFYLGLTVFGVPFVAMGYEMSDDFHERTSIMAISQWIGQWAWVIVPWFWVVIYDPNWFAAPDVAVRQLAVGISVFCGILAVIPAIFIKSESTLNEKDFAHISLGNMIGSLKEIVENAKVAFSIKQFRMLCFSTFFTFNAYNLAVFFTFYIIVNYLFGGSPEKAGLWPTLHGSVGALVTTFIVIPIVNLMAHKIGKKKTFLYSQAISIIGFILFWFLFIPGKPWAFLFALPFVSFGIGGLFTVMMSMTSDVCDLDELHTHQRREGIFGAIYWWMVKLGAAIAGGLSGLLMTIVGYDSTLKVQTEFTITWLRIFYTVIPIMGTLAAIWIMRNYDIDEKRAKEIKKQLIERRKKKL